MHAARISLDHGAGQQASALDPFDISSRADALMTENSVSQPASSGRGRR